MKPSPVPLHLLRAALTVAAAGLLGAGCDTHDCADTCGRVFEQGLVGGEQACAAEHPGQNTEEAVEACLSECEDALDNPGPMGSYNPNERASGSQASPELVTDMQAAAWMDCVWTTDCDFLREGYCAPVSFGQ